MPKFCSECGAEAEGMKFCPECGTALEGGASHPVEEGRAFADELRASGLAVELVEDKEAPTELAGASLLLVGADTVFRDGTLCNKIGTRDARGSGGRAGGTDDRRLRGDQARPDRERQGTRASARGARALRPHTARARVRGRDRGGNRPKRRSALAG